MSLGPGQVGAERVEGEESYWVPASASWNLGGERLWSWGEARLAGMLGPRAHCWPGRLARVGLGRAQSLRSKVPVSRGQSSSPVLAEITFKPSSQQGTPTESSFLYVLVPKEDFPFRVKRGSNISTFRS